MDIVALAALAGNAVANAAVTDAWEYLRHKIAWLLGRGQPDPKIERRLDATRQALEGIQSAELEQAQGAEAARWQTRFCDFLADYPDAAAELDALVRGISANAPSAGDHSAAAGRDMNIAARDGGVAAGVVHGNVTLGPTAPGPASS